ncbi:unnamed protein product [Linum trigynum]|uniref:Uncharacterized protein n=1 Tax=Linum trigynum TaxID=586398 RepID=A0AAV2E2D3_9ROSI
MLRPTAGPLHSAHLILYQVWAQQSETWVLDHVVVARHLRFATYGRDLLCGVSSSLSLPRGPPASSPTRSAAACPRVGAVASPPAPAAASLVVGTPVESPAPVAARWPATAAWSTQATATPPQSPPWSPNAAAILLCSSCMLVRSCMIMSHSRLASSTSVCTSSMLESVFNCIAMMVRIEALRSSFSVSFTTTPSRRLSPCGEET